MSSESEAVIELPLPPHQSPPINDQAAESNVLSKIGTGIALSALALGCRLSETNPDVEKLPAAATFMINSGAHPILGFVGGMTGKFVSDRIADTGRRAYVALGVVMAASFDIATEAAQDKIIPTEYPFYAPQKAFESSKDMVFALGGFGIALWLNRRRGPESTAEYN